MMERPWNHDAGRHAWGAHQAWRRQPATIPELVAEAAEPLPDVDDPAFGKFFDRFGDKRIVLLGEASHGTAEFYRARAAITRRLVEAHGFRIVAVEADWPDAAAIDRYVRHRPFLHGSPPPFQRFPAWMWRNLEVEAFMEWLRDYNGGIARLEGRTGFYGLDLYNMNASIAAVLQYLDEVDPAAAAVARTRYGCLAPWQGDPATYGRAAFNAGFGECEAKVVAQLCDLLESRLRYLEHDGANFLDAAQNARLVAAAERYYRVMYYGGAESWNLRDTHMFETLGHLLDARGLGSKAVVWAHNSHIGDARHTDMGAARGQLNIGQLCREGYGDQVALVGFGTHAGTVAAASDWDGEMEIKRVRPSLPESYERVCHDAGIRRFLLDLRPGVNRAARGALMEPRLQRFIGVIYRPETEFASHYSATVLPRQYDAFAWFDQTSAVTPLGEQHPRPGAPDTYPFGL